ncbi:MAG: hypothetical protein H0V50_02205 [Thermoleophilaceae bacterium]|nr:hypothetical protein [Thermoleophilaceae bacterium]
MHEAAPTFVRWLWIWITILALVVVVVIGFLLGIVSSLESIDDGLFEADNSVTGAGKDVKPLPDHIKNINRNLTKIDTSLKPITGQADDIQSALSAINGSLVSVDGSLKDTSGSLVNTSGSLVDTNGKLGNITGLLVDTAGDLVTISGSLVNTTGKLGVISSSLVNTSNELVSVTRLAATIDNTLIRAQSVNSLGTNAIWRRVRFINGGPFRGPDGTQLGGAGENPNGLESVLADADDILGGLRQVNKHLTSVCQAPALTIPVPGLITPGPC